MDMINPWRVGRRVGRTIYEQVGPEPSDDDILIGMLDTPDLAAEAVATRNFTRVGIGSATWRAFGGEDTTYCPDCEVDVADDPQTYPNTRECPGTNGCPLGAGGP